MNGEKSGDGPRCSSNALSLQYTVFFAPLEAASIGARLERADDRNDKNFDKLNFCRQLFHGIFMFCVSTSNLRMVSVFVVKFSRRMGVKVQFYAEKINFNYVNYCTLVVKGETITSTATNTYSKDLGWTRVGNPISH